MSNVVENLVPYATYRWAEYKARAAEDQIKRETGEKAPETHCSRMDKEFLTPKYEASIGSDFEDGLFDGTAQIHRPSYVLNVTNCLQSILMHPFGCRFSGACLAVRNGDHVCERVPARRHLRTSCTCSGNLLFVQYTFVVLKLCLISCCGVLQNNLVEIRSDALKLLVTMRRPAPRQAASIGAWLSIFQV